MLHTRLALVWFDVFGLKGSTMIYEGMIFSEERLREGIRCSRGPSFRTGRINPLFPISCEFHRILSNPCPLEPSVHDTDHCVTSSQILMWSWLNYCQVVQMKLWKISDQNYVNNPFWNFYQNLPLFLWSMDYRKIRLIWMSPIRNGFLRRNVYFIQ